MMGRVSARVAHGCPILEVRGMGIKRSLNTLQQRSGRKGAGKGKSRFLREMPPMKRPMPYSIGLLHFLFLAICLLIAAAGLVLLSDRSGPVALLVAPLGAGFLLVLLSWLVFAREVLGSIAGNLAVKSPAVKTFEPAVTIKGYWGKMALLAASIADVLRESIAVLYGIENGPCRRLCYIGSDSFAEGRVAGEALGRVLAGQGSVAIIVSNLCSVNYILRRKGAMDVLAEKFPGIEVIGTIESFEIGERTYSSSLDLMDRYRDLSAIYMAEGNTPSYA